MQVSHYASIKQQPEKLRKYRLTDDVSPMPLHTVMQSNTIIITIITAMSPTICPPSSCNCECLAYALYFLSLAH